MAQQNKLNKKATQLTIDPGASGDSFVQFDINATGKYRVGVDATDDSFRVAIGSALGTSDALVATAAGEVTKPLTPAFLAYIASDDTNVTGAGTPYALGTTVAFTEVYDQNSDFNTNGTFTAPVTGRYYFTGAVRLGAPSGGGNSAGLRFITSNRTYIGNMLPLQDQVASFADSSGSIGLTYGILTDMDASDTCQLAVNATGGSDTCDVLGSSTLISYFAGYLAV